MVDHSAAPARTGGGRRALSPAMRTFLVIDVILVLTFLVVAAMQLAGGPSDPPAEEPAAQEAAPGSTCFLAHTMPSIVMTCRSPDWSR